MAKNFLCKCDNCNAILIDSDPFYDSILFDTAEITATIGVMVQVPDDGDMVWACGICKKFKHLRNIDKDYFQSDKGDMA